MDSAELGVGTKKAGTNKSVGCEVGHPARHSLPSQRQHVHGNSCIDVPFTCVNYSLQCEEIAAMNSPGVQPMQARRLHSPLMVSAELVA